MVFEIGDGDLARADRYEVSGYHRVAVVPARGKTPGRTSILAPRRLAGLEMHLESGGLEEHGASLCTPAELAPVRRLLVEDHRLGLEERVQPFDPAFPADARLLESAERDAEVGAERVVSYGTRSELARR